MLELFFRCSFHTTKLKAPDQLNNMSKMCFGIDNIDFIWVTKLVESDCLKHISQWKFVSSFQQYDKCQERANTLNWLTFFWNGKSGHCSVFLIVLSLLPNFCVCVSVKSDWIEQIIWLSCLESNSNSNGSSSAYCLAWLFWIYVHDWAHQRWTYLSWLWELFIRYNIALDHLIKAFIHSL